MALPPLATPEQLAVRAGRPAADPVLNARLRDASRRFREAVGWNVSRTEGELVELNGDGGRILLLPVKYVQAITTVSVDGVELASRGYRLDKRNGILERVGGVWPRGLARVHVTYSHGFDATTKDDDDPAGLAHVPDGIQGAVLGMAEILLNITAGLASRTVLGDTVQFGAAASVGATQEWTDAVTNYKIRGGA